MRSWLALSHSDPLSSILIHLYRFLPQADVAREKAAFKVSADIVASQGKNVESKTWWLVRDNLRGQAYNMKANMLAINKQLPADKKAAAAKAYATLWKEVDARKRHSKISFQPPHPLQGPAKELCLNSTGGHPAVGAKRLCSTLPVFLPECSSCVLVCGGACSRPCVHEEGACSRPEGVR